MKVAMLTGSHSRHLYVAHQLYAAGLLQSLVIEQREEMIPPPPNGLNEMDHQNFIRHFQDRDAAELAFFGKADEFDLSGLPRLHVTYQELNGERVKNWISEHKPDVVISYGIHILNRELLSLFPEQSWNIHGGLSPWYRGNTTLFWPFYFLKPNWAGMTIHYLTTKLDGGDIIHHSTPQLLRGDGIHDVACRAVEQASKDIIVILNKLHSGAVTQGSPQKSLGKLFTSEDWKPQHLRLIYNTFNNDIVDKYLDGELGHQEPPLIRAF